MWIIRTEIACVTLFTPRFPDPVVQTHIKTPDSEYVKIGELQCVDRVVMMVISSDGIAAWASDHIIWESNTVATRTLEPNPNCYCNTDKNPSFHIGLCEMSDRKQSDKAMSKAQNCTSRMHSFREILFRTAPTDIPVWHSHFTYWIPYPITAIHLYTTCSMILKMEGHAITRNGTKIESQYLYFKTLKYLETRELATVKAWWKTLILYLMRWPCRT